MDNNKKIIGCSFDGLKDRFFVDGNNSPTGTDFYLADVVLPLHNGGRLLAGEEAECNRVSSGYHWPPDAQVKSDNHLRRIPVSWAWRLFIDAEEKYGSRYTRWKIGEGVSFNISKILAAHIAEKLDNEEKNAKEIVIAIPNDLNEFRQEEFIKDLISQGIGSRKERPHLIWRPIAAALAWLDKVQVPENISNDDFILVVHIGPDSVEFVTLRLRKIVHGSKRYVVPVRETLHNKYSLCGCDWAAEFIGQEFDTNEPDEIWQCFTNFPETWKTLAQQPWNAEELPRVWSRRDSWELWQPEENCQEGIWQLEARNSSCLDALTRENYKHKRTETTFDSWKKFLQRGMIEALENCENGNLCGVILSGPLTSTLPSPWLEEAVPLLKNRGLNVEVRREARFDSIWAPDFEQDIVSEGASIYGVRLARGEPTYLDTIPQLFTYANIEGRADWVPLLKTLEIKGGKEYPNTLVKCFSLKQGSKELEVFLKKGDSLEFKKAPFSFSYEPKEKMPIDIRICVASANGLATVELIPENKEFLSGQRVFMDYSRMEDTRELPETKLGFPLVTDFIVDHTDYKIHHGFQQISNEFLGLKFKDQSYDNIVHKLREEIHKPTWFPNASGTWINGRIVDKNGNTGTAEGQVIINKISSKLGSDFDRILSSGLANIVNIAARDRFTKILRKVLGASTWLFGAVSPEVLCCLRERLEGENVKPDFVEGAGRCFVEKDDLEVLFKAAVRRIHYVGRTGYGNAFPIQWSRAIWRVLLLRENAPDAMEKEQAKIFVEYSLENMEDHASRDNYEQVFFQSIKMFVCILRFRVKDPTFLSPRLENEDQIFKRIISCLEKAQEYFRNAGRNNRNIKAGELMEEIIKYMHYEGTANIMDAVNALAGEKDE